MLFQKSKINIQYKHRKCNIINVIIDTIVTYVTNCENK